MPYSRGWPTGRNEERSRTPGREGAEQFGESKVVAGGEASRSKGRVDHDDLIAATHEGCLAAIEAEEVDLSVTRGEASIRSEEGRRVVVATVVSYLSERAAVQPDPVLLGQRGEARDQRSVDGLGVGPRSIDIECPHVPQLRENHEVCSLSGLGDE